MPEPQIHVHVAFGFHVNLYHSFRGDAPDESGIGRDIRVIRRILDVLDDFNAQGVPVRGTWDFDHCFSLEEALPRHAPDLLPRLQRRVQEAGDEPILMSYDNGLVSAMTREEFQAAIGRAIRNEKGSGLHDLFGRFAPVVRPQEMVFTPVHARWYRELGVEAVTLYYSAVAFDAFRTLVPLLPPEQAFNPLRYTHGETSILVVPTLNHGDLAEHGSLRRLVRWLHRMQERGRVRSDVLVFVNMDADSEFWYGYRFPRWMRWLPNTGGLAQLVESVRSLPYVRFDTPGAYLAGHPARGELSFTQDVADGAFDGYASWAEKPFNARVWTRVERSRLLGERLRALLPGLESGAPEVARAVRDHLTEAFEKRLRLLSTTHFGLAAPVLNAQRERAAEELSRSMESGARAALAAAVGALGAPLVPGGDEGEDAGAIVASFHLLPPLPTGSPAGEAAAAGDPRAPAHVRLALAPGTLRAGDALSVELSERRPSEASLPQVPAVAVPAARHPDDSLAEVDLFVSAAPSGAATESPGREAAGTCSPPRGSWMLVRRRVASEAGGAGEKRIPRLLESGRLRIELQAEPGSPSRAPGAGQVPGAHTPVRGVTFAGTPLGGPDFLTPYLVYRPPGRPSPARFALEGVGVEPLGALGRGATGITWQGRFRLPQPAGAAEGAATYRIFVVEGIEALFLQGSLRYPHTHETEAVADEISDLQRLHDPGWMEVAPAELRPLLGEDPWVFKEHPSGTRSRYRVDLSHVDPANYELDSLNQHVTPGWVGVGDGENGLLLATDVRVASSFAFCPMRFRRHGGRRRLFLNPFGTYHGRQRHHPTYGSGLGQELAQYGGAHLAPLAPAYNGARIGFLLAVVPFLGPEPPEEAWGVARSLARGPWWLDGRPEQAPGDAVELEPPRAVPAEVGVRPRSLSQSLPLALQLRVLWDALRGGEWRR